MEEKMLDKVQQVENELHLTKLQLEGVKDQLETAKKELKREKAKNKSINKQTEVSTLIQNL